ncbi:MAG: RnfH family protein [Wenzhouxiangellaceae bacterium]|nr:RnfH family protein [Wenzhouxiangellaceae bacterium]
MGESRCSKTLTAEVAVAWPKLQVVVAVSLYEGATVADAIDASGFKKRFPELEIRADRVGVFGSLRALDAPLSGGDRVEIYRPLKVDPKTARRLAALK